MAKADIMAGRAYVSLYMKNGIAAGLRAAQKDLSQFGSNMMSIGAQITTVSAGLLAPLVASVAVASDLEETMSKFGVVFGDAAGQTKAWSDKFAADVGRSKLQIAGFMAASQDLFVPIGFEAGAANEMSRQVTQLAVDLASFNNMQDPDTLRDLHAALTGSGEVMKKYGVIVSEAAVKQQLLNSGMDPKNATEMQKVQARLAIIMAGTSAAQGDALRTAGSFANRLKALKSSVTDVAAELGTALLPSLAEIAGNVTTAVKSVASFVRNNQGAVLGFAAIAAAAFAAGAAIAGIGGMAYVAASGAGALAAMMGIVTTVVSAVLSPIGMLSAALIAGVYAWARFTKGGQSAVTGLSTIIGETFGAISTTVRETLGGIVAAIQAGDLTLAGQIAMIGLRLVMMQGLEAIHSLFGEAWGTLASQLMSGDFAGAWSTFGSMILDTMAGVASGMVSLFSNAANAVMAKWQQTVNKISDYILESASQGGVMGWALEQISGVNMQEEAARAARLNAQAGAMGLAQDAGVVTSAEYQDPALEAMKAKVAAAGEAAKAAMDASTEATGTALADATSGSAAETSDSVKALQAELAALQAEAAAKLAAVKSGQAELGGKPAGGMFGGAGGSGGKVSAASFNLAQLAMSSGRSYEYKQLAASQKQVTLQEQAVDIGWQTLGAISGWSLHHP